MPRTDDKKLIIDIQSGSARAFTELVDKYKSKAFTIAYRIIRNREDAQEIAQDAFISVYKNIHSFRLDSTFSTWLYRIIYNAAISKIRTNKNVPEAMDEVTEQPRNEQFDSEFAKLSNQEQAKFINIAMSNLPGDEAALLTLFYLEENTIDEITEITGLTNSNVKVKLFRARKKMNEQLQRLLQNEVNTILTF